MVSQERMGYQVHPAPKESLPERASRVTVVWMGILVSSDPRERGAPRGCRGSVCKGNLGRRGTSVDLVFRETLDNQA